MTGLHMRAVQLFIFIVLHEAPRLGLATDKSMNYNNPRFFKIGGVLSNDDSKSHFEKTIDVREQLYIENSKKSL